jgi:hypothetical protein
MSLKRGLSMLREVEDLFDVVRGKIAFALLVDLALGLVDL